MDDDIVIEPSVLGKTDAFLRLLKPEYRRHFLAGAMLRLDRPLVQHEATAWWNGVRIHPHKHNLDLSLPRRVLENEIENKKKHPYAAWWYCVMPLSREMINDLPLPFFMNGDDIEYSLRRAAGLISLNGIAVWHQALEFKYNPVKKYYLTTRNALVINARHGFSLPRSLVLIYIRIMNRVLRRHSIEARLVWRGVCDFLRGPQYLPNLTSGRLLTRETFLDLTRQRVTVRRVITMTFFLILHYGKLARMYRRMPLTAGTWNRIFAQNRDGPES
jgi:GT2 family glycosyltransferase